MFSAGQPVAIFCDIKMVEVFSSKRYVAVKSNADLSFPHNAGHMLVKTRKFMQTLDSKLYLELEKVARMRGITVQQLLRAVVVPEWFRNESTEKPSEVSRSRLHRKLRPRRLPARVTA